MLEKINAFLKKKNVIISYNRYLIKVLGSMAMGLFSTLLIGTILNSIGQKFEIPFLTERIWPIANKMTGPAIAVAIAHSLEAPPLVLFSSVCVGFGAYETGGPVGAWLGAWFAVELGKLVSKETKIDIIITPIVTVLFGILIGDTVGPIISKLMTSIGEFIMIATTLQPFIMGILVSLVLGIVLTLPISSAALCMMLSLGGLAGGAATCGCSAQMIGFAIISYKENGIGGIFAQGLGTSMLQIPNIIKNWKIWIPPTLASAITGPMSTLLFKMENIPLGSGMGTCGLVGQIGTITAMSEKGFNLSNIYSGIIILHFVLPALLSYIFYKVLYKINWIKDGDMKLDL